MGHRLSVLSFPICIPIRTITNQLCGQDKYAEKVLDSAFLKYVTVQEAVTDVPENFFFFPAVLIRT